jgi:hypothetical protein
MAPAIIIMRPFSSRGFRASAFMVERSLLAEPPVTAAASATAAVIPASIFLFNFAGVCHLWCSPGIDSFLPLQPHAPNLTEDPQMRKKDSAIDLTLENMCE